MKTIFVLAAALSLMACSKDGGGSKSDAKRNLADHQIIQKTKLNDPQKEEIRTIMSKLSNAPDIYLILSAPDDSAEGREHKEKAVKKLTPEAKKNYDRILADCEISTPAKSSTGSTDVGGKQISDYLGKADGARCPVVSSRKEHIEMTTLENNLKELQDEYKKTNDPAIFKKYSSKSAFQSEVASQTKIIDPRLQDQVGYQFESTSQTTTGSASSSATESQSSTTTRGKMLLVSNEGQKITADIVIESEQSTAEKEAYFEISMQYPSSEAVVQIFQNSKSKRIYLNGESITDDQLKSIFGNRFGPTED